MHLDESYANPGQILHSQLYLIPVTDRCTDFDLKMKIDTIVAD